MPTASYTRIAGAFSGRTKRQTVGVLSRRIRQRWRSPRLGMSWLRAAGSTQTCWSWTALGVQAEASALKRIVPSSAHSHDRRSWIWPRVRLGTRRDRARADPRRAPRGVSPRRRATAGRCPRRGPAARCPHRQAAGRARRRVAPAGPRAEQTCEPRQTPEVGHRLFVADDHSCRRLGRRPAKAPQPSPDGTTFAPK